MTSKDLTPGTKLGYRDKSVVVLDRRKDPAEHRSADGPFWLVAWRTW